MRSSDWQRVVEVRGAVKERRVTRSLGRTGHSTLSQALPLTTLSSRAAFRPDWWDRSTGFVRDVLAGVTST